MSLSRNYLAIENAEDAEAALSYLFTAAGDTAFTADKRVNECFYKRGRGRKMNPDLFSYVQTSDDVGEEDITEEIAITEERKKIINSYLERKIAAIEEEFEEQQRITKNMRGLILDLKSIYAYIFSKLDANDPNMFKDYVSPRIDVEPWVSQWSQDHLELESLNNYTKEEVYSKDKGETQLLKNIKNKISYDRYRILDELIEYFKKVSRGDIVEYILVNGFKFISESTTGITNTHSLTEEDYHVVNAARVTYISRRKIDLNYALELVNLPATTYKKRSNKIKLEILDLGEEFGDVANNKMKDFLIN